MADCPRCDASLEGQLTFRYDNLTACRRHLLDFQTIGVLEFLRFGKREFLYSATQSELQELVNDRSTEDISVRSFEWVNKPQMASRPLRVSNAYKRNVRWITLRK